uniref:Guanine nucleotide-binding protein G(I) subunit alpha n=1 Tax=Macrostomum lignano TaxID=282301 RepID=A0A1I8FJJ4_9PLAT
MRQQRSGRPQPGQQEPTDRASAPSRRREGDEGGEAAAAGAGECGKSTILKQMTIIHGKGYSEEERKEYVAIVYANTVQSMSTILQALETLGIEASDAVKSDAKIVNGYVRSAEEGEFPQELVAALRRLWWTPLCRECFARAKEYQLNDSAGYYLDSLDRLAAPGYLPTEQDVLRSRVKTTGIVETNFHFKDLDFKVYDAGRVERKKWMHCFEGVTAILFLVAMSEYDLKLVEDQTTNRMHESMRLFESICNSQWFVNTSIILFLKQGATSLRRKSSAGSLTSASRNIRAPTTYDEASQYIRVKFEDLNKRKATKTIYTHFTCATDTTTSKWCSTP